MNQVTAVGSDSCVQVALGVRGAQDMCASYGIHVKYAVDGIMYPVAKRGVMTILRGECPQSETLMCCIRAGAQLWGHW